MAADFISITRTNRPQMGNQWIRAANLLRELRDLTDALNDGGSHMFNGADYTVLEAQVGLTAGTGANALALLGNLHTILNTNGTVAGDTRLSQLDEFVARLAGQ